MTLTLEDISQGYGRRPVIDRLSLELSPGVVGLLGPNGAGKTTLLRTMATVMPPKAGTMSLGAVTVTGERQVRLVRNQIGYLPQDFGYEPGMRVLDFVRYAAWMRGMPSRDWDAAARVALEKVDLHDERRTRMKKLSGGMRRRAGIAWAIVGEPLLVLLDEPTVGLDPRQRLQFRRIVSGLSSSIVVLSTHLIDDIDAVCDRVVVLHGGEIRFDGTTRALENLARHELPGNSALERAYMSLLPDEEQNL
ncbi:ABC transporter ATP-binding protein [Pilimelia anulata]|uniref:ABC transporter ATP-binding protein n=1 Tax=Pilimelia anulata TaxID=53371 RepID=A0A8J3B7E8_9ACTN|nr:ATP-binding cassette domain-containing protein [Pilimelia anulata]GGJ93465.1 ABC transporter ATP-binding protein [Pilimelia anulata]